MRRTTTDFIADLKTELARMSFEQNQLLEICRDSETGPESYERVKERQGSFREGFYHGARWAVELLSKK